MFELMSIFEGDPEENKKIGKIAVFIACATSLAALFL